MTVYLTVHDRGHELCGVVRDGESWAAAARRTCGGVHGAPVPLDLSGEVKHFAIDHDTTISVRAMSRGDLPDVVRWRQADHVHRWWAGDGDPTEERVVQQYGPDIDGRTPTRMWVAEVNGRSPGVPPGLTGSATIRSWPCSRLTPTQWESTTRSATRPGWGVDSAFRCCGSG